MAEVVKNKIREINMKNLSMCVLLGATASAPAFATFAGGAMGVPAPMGGALGPWGIGVAVVGYGGYRLVKYIRNR